MRERKQENEGRNTYILKQPLVDFMGTGFQGGIAWDLVVGTHGPEDFDGAGAERVGTDPDERRDTRSR